MKNLSTTIASYSDEASAEKDWAAVEGAASAGSIDLADAALVTKGPDGSVSTVNRQSHHGWGKGGIAGAIVGVVFPPSIVVGAVAGGVAGGVVSRMNRSPDKGDIKDLGKVMSSGQIAVVMLTSADASRVSTSSSRGRPRS